MREKDKPLNIVNPISQRIIKELIKRNGNDSLFDISSHIMVHQGTLRRRLEARDKSWAVAEDLFNIAKYLNVDYEWLLSGKSKHIVANDENKKWMTRALDAEKRNQQLEKDIKNLKSALLSLKKLKI
ncbi:MAG: hypothetical protein EHM58_00405 [Ignavibacteriae bacterium]|nr:MAG: hypothetical protein EHM58_00405 [Ignavibacteriota bacterium]